MRLTELDDDVLLLVLSNFVKVLTNEHLDWLGVPVGWYRLTHQMRLQQTITIIYHQLTRSSATAEKQRVSCPHGGG